MSKQTADDQAATPQGDDSVEPASEGAETAADNVRSMKRAKKKVAAAVDEARERFQNVAADVGERFQQASTVAQEKSRKAREAAREKYQAASEQMKDGYVKVRKDVDYMVDDVNDFVRQKPGTAILIAAGAGFLLGLLFRPGRRRD